MLIIIPVPRALKNQNEKIARCRNKLVAAISSHGSDSICAFLDSKRSAVERKFYGQKSGDSSQQHPNRLYTLYHNYKLGYESKNNLLRIEKIKQITDRGRDIKETLS